MSGHFHPLGPLERLAQAVAKLAGDVAWTVFPPRPSREPALAQAESFVETGRPEQAAPLLAPMRRDVERMQGPCGPACRARWHLAWGYCRGCASSLDEAWFSFDAARREAADVEDAGLAARLRLRAQVEMAIVALAKGQPLDDVASLVDESVRLSAGVEDPYALMRLGHDLGNLGQAEHQAGRWKAARAHYEQALATGLRVPAPALLAADAETRGLLVWAEARAIAGRAAMEIARTLATLGDVEGMREWFDRGLAAMEGPAHPRLLLSRGVLSLERARAESGDDVLAPARRISWLREAVRAGLARGDADGRALACRAGLELAEQLRGVGDCAAAAEQARRVEEHRAGLPPAAAAICATEARLALGLALLDGGDEAGALAALREAVERGRAAPAPDARLYAAAAAWHLHATLLGDRRIAEAGAALDALEEMVPALGAEQRPAFVALMGYMRGTTRLAEGRHEEAHADLERAEGAARRLEKPDPELVRSAAAGLGNVALEEEDWHAAEAHFRRALAALPDDARSARRQAVRAELLLGVARALAPDGRVDEALALIREAFTMGMASGCSLGRKVAAHAALVEGDAPMLETGERRRLYQTAARLGRVSGLAQGRAIAEQAETRLGDLSP
jgi:tetratricopeptide (TPR) repeat protein